MEDASKKPWPSMPVPAVWWPPGMQTWGSAFMVIMSCSSSTAMLFSPKTMFAIRLIIDLCPGGTVAISFSAILGIFISFSQAGAKP